MGREGWPRAVDRLFSMGYVPAEESITRYRRWVKSRTWSQDVKKHMNAWGFLQLSRDLKALGVIPWELKHVRTQAKERHWARCTRSFRVKADEWLRVQAVRNLAPRSLITLRYELLSLGTFLGIHHLSYKDLTYPHAIAWLEQVRSSGLVATGINQKLHVAKRFYAWLKARKLVSDSPLETFRSARVSRKLPKILEEAEVVRLIRAARPGRQVAVLEVLYASGCRVGELCKLDLAKVSFEEATARTVGKGGHETIVYLNESALSAIRSYLPLRDAILRRHGCGQEKALFLSGYGSRITPFAVREIVEQVVQRANLGKHVYPHMFRHAFATHLLNRGADLYSLMQFLGHKNIQ
jgi:site-specific recombinase XerD